MLIQTMNKINYIYYLCYNKNGIPFRRSKRRRRHLLVMSKRIMGTRIQLLRNKVAVFPGPIKFACCRQAFLQKIHMVSTAPKMSNTQRFNINVNVCYLSLFIVTILFRSIDNYFSDLNISAVIA